MAERTSQEEISRQWTVAQPIVSAFVSSLVPNYHDAQDILQNVAVAIVRKADTYNPNEPFVNWAIGVARYEVLGYRRKRATDRHVFDDEALAVITEQYNKANERFSAMDEALEYCLRPMGQAARRLLQLRYGEGLLPSDIAKTLGRSANAVTVGLHRIRASLKQCILKRIGRSGAAS